jgi:ATP synthase F1 delta subunit
MNSIEQLAEQLVSRIHTTSVLHHLSAVLESYAGDQSLKTHLNRIATDAFLSDHQKRNQLMEIIQAADNRVLNDFMADMVSRREYWLFSSGKFDYFDQFVRAVQYQVEKVISVQLITAVELKPNDVIKLANQFSQILENKAVLTVKVDHSILGGVQMRIENMVYDYSLQTRFRKFRSQWIRSFTKATKLMSTE